MNMELRYGVLCGFGLCCWVLLEFALGFHTTSLEIGQFSGYFSAIIPAVIIYAALKITQNRYSGILPFSAAVNTGFQISIYASAIFSIFLFVYNNYINPDWIQSMIEWQRRSMIIDGATDDEIGRFMEQHRRMNTAAAQGVMSFISMTGLGVVLTLIEIPLIRISAKFFKRSGSRQ